MLRLFLKRFFSLLAETYRQWDAHRGPKMGAALAFYAVFSLAPLAILVLTLISMVVERSAAREEIVTLFGSFVGNQAAGTMEMILTQSSPANASFFSTLAGLAVLLIGASGVFGELQDSLNQIWGVTSQRHPLLVILWERLFSFSMVFALGLLMLLSFLFSAFIAAAGSLLLHRFPELDGPWELGNSAISLMAVTMLFALIFRIVPQTRITWKDVGPGAILTALLFEMGKFVLGFYFGRSAIATSYGAAGSLVIILVWVFYSAQILFFGAEFTRLYTVRHGSRRPDDHPKH